MTDVERWPVEGEWFGEPGPKTHWDWSTVSSPEDEPNVIIRPDGRGHLRVQTRRDGNPREKIVDDVIVTKEGHVMVRVYLPQ